MMPKTKILFFHFDLGEGGAERVLVNLLNHLDQTKYEITLKTIFSGTINRNNLKPHIKFSPIFNRNAFRGTRLLLKLFPPSWINKVLIKGKYDIQIAYLEGIPTRIIGAISSRSVNKKYAWIHVSPKSKKDFVKCYRSYKEFKKIYESFDKLAFVSKKALFDFEKYYDIKTPKTIVHNINDFDKIKELSTKPLEINLNDTLNLISMGRLTRQKRFDRLLNVLFSLKQNGYINWHLYLLGKGELKRELTSMVDSMGLSNYVTLLGFQDNPYKFISKMDLFVCSSEREGFSTAVTEAAFLEIPILTTDCAGMDEIIDSEKSGFIVHNSEDGLYQGLKNYFDLNQSQLAQLKLNAINNSKRFNNKTTIKEFENFINK